MNAFLAALINGIILSGAAAAALWLVLRLTPRRTLNAASRYVAWCAALIVTAAAPLSWRALPERLRRQRQPPRSCLSPM